MLCYPFSLPVGHTNGDDELSEYQRYERCGDIREIHTIDGKELHQFG